MLLVTLLQQMWPTQHQRSAATPASVHISALLWTQRCLPGHLVRLSGKETTLCSPRRTSRIWPLPSLRTSHHEPAPSDGDWSQQQRSEKHTKWHWCGAGGDGN